MPDRAETVEVSWFSALCDDDYEFLGVSDPALQSSFAHCREIVLRAERCGFDNILLPSGYALGIDSVAFAGGVAPELERMRLLVAVRCGELRPPQLARQLATLDRMLGGRLTINIISSDVPGAPLESLPRYARTLEVMKILRTLLDGKPVSHRGEFFSLELEAPRIGTVSGRCPPFYFGGLSAPARNVAAEAADVFLMWPDTEAAIVEIMDDLKKRAAVRGRTRSATAAPLAPPVVLARAKAGRKPAPEPQPVEPPAAKSEKGFERVAESSPRPDPAQSATAGFWIIRGGVLFDPNRPMTSAVGPTQTRPASTQAAAISGLSARNP